MLESEKDKEKGNRQMKGGRERDSGAERERGREKERGEWEARARAFPMQSVAGVEIHEGYATAWGSHLPHKLPQQLLSGGRAVFF